MKRFLILGLLLGGCTTPGPPPPSTPLPTPTAVESSPSTPTAPATPAESATPSGWVPFKAPDGSFSVVLPGPVDIQEDEDGLELTARAEPGAQVEIDLERHSNAKVAARHFEEKIKDARSGKLKSEKRDGNRVVLVLEDSRGAPFTNALVLSGERVIDLMAVGDESEVKKVLDSLEVQAPK